MSIVSRYGSFSAAAKAACVLFLAAAAPQAGTAQAGVSHGAWLSAAALQPAGSPAATQAAASPAASPAVAPPPAAPQPAGSQVTAPQAAASPPAAPQEADAKLPPIPPPGTGHHPIRLLVFGDSLVAGYGLPTQDGFQAQLAAALQADGYDVQLLDGGVSGDTSAGGRARIDWALTDHPDAALVELGANDGLRGSDPAQMQANLTAILDALDAHHVRTLLTGMEAPPNLGATYGAQFRAVYTRLGQRPGLLFDRFFLDGVAAQPGLIQDDHLHPNAKGVTREVARIKPVVERLIGAK